MKEPENLSSAFWRFVRRIAVILGTGASIVTLLAFFGLTPSVLLDRFYAYVYCEDCNRELQASNFWQEWEQSSKCRSEMIFVPVSPPENGRQTIFIQPRESNANLSCVASVDLSTQKIIASSDNTTRLNTAPNNCLTGKFGQASIYSPVCGKGRITIRPT